MHIGYTSNRRAHEMEYLENASKGRLRHLKTLAWMGNGACTPILRIAYISIIYSVTDYAAPVHTTYNKGPIKGLWSYKMRP